MDIDFVRGKFAGLENEAGKETGLSRKESQLPWLFLDNAGGAFVLTRVIDRIADYLRSTPVQLGGSYPLSLLAAQRQQQATAALAEWINANYPEELVFGPSATALTWRLAVSLGDFLSSGDEIIVTNLDHEANRSPWLRLTRNGIQVRTWEVEGDTGLDLDRLDSMLGERTRLVCISHCSNILGRIEPVAEIARRVHAAGARLFVDGVAYAPHRQLDMQAIGADFYVFSLYKTFGPHAGLLWGNREALLELKGINHEYLEEDALPYKFQPGGANYELNWGSAGIPEYFAELDQHLRGDGSGATAWQQIAEHEAALAERLLDYLANRKDVKIVGPRDAGIAERLPIIAFCIEGFRSRDVVSHLEKHHIAARHGHFHARRLLERLGIDTDDGVVRVSFAHYNSMADVERLISALDNFPE